MPTPQLLAKLPGGWLAAPVVVVAVAGAASLGYHLVSSGSASPKTAVQGLSIKPGAPSGNSAGNNGNGNASGGGAPGKSFTLNGSVAGLAPGVTVNIPLVVDNPNSQAMRLTSVTATASGGSSSCPNSLLLLGSPATAVSGSAPFSVVVSAKSSTTSVTDPNFPVTLSPAAPDVCQSFKWTLTYAASAAQA